MSKAPPLYSALISRTISIGKYPLSKYSPTQTGTLTEGDLDLAGVCETRDAQFQENVSDPMNLASDSLLVQTMASCHSLVKIEGELTGYPMDIKLFEAINWVILYVPFTRAMSLREDYSGTDRAEAQWLQP